ncbi:caspase domain-containing protein [Streptomyces sp. NPDC015661]|uniref:caspase family protein n=1 Tax=Streptomyces sp. NPDC015661 TaxID=3364961 RepID=UPI0036FFB657
MGSIYALLVGIDDYPPETAPPLRGCLNDISEARRLLEERGAGDVFIRTLLNDEATRAAVEDAVRGHLGRAGAEDTALLWFSGHGTQSLARAEAHLRIEATGRNQALVCVDGPLLDKRLGRLLDGVASRGAHVAAVLDCCFSGGATRADERVRYVAPAPSWDLTDGAGEGLPSAATRAASPGPGWGPPHHVLLAAARLDQYSYEDDYAGRRHGAFTYALLGAVHDAGEGATYRELLSAADARLQRSGGRQQPVLYPARPGSLADAPFLGGAVGRPRSPHLLRFGALGWEVDCGAAHGLADGTDPEATEFTVLPSQAPETGPAPSLRARAVQSARTLVDPVGWTPSTSRVYPVALSAVPQPPATVRCTAAEPASGLLDAVRTEIALVPTLRVLDDPRQAGDLHFRVHLEGGLAHVLRRDGTPFTDPLPLRGPDGAERVAACLSHLTRWHLIRDLAPGPSALDGLVRVEIAPWEAPDEVLTPDASGEIVCSYGSDAWGGSPEPRVSIRLRNRSADRALWCVLIDLTTDYASHTQLFPGHFIGPGRTGHALDGEPVQLCLAPDRPAVPGASARDWLKLIVSESELNVLPYELDAWDPSLTGSRLMRRVSAPRGRWTARTVALRTVVPPVAASPTAPGG